MILSAASSWIEINLTGMDSSLRQFFFICLAAAGGNDNRNGDDCNCSTHKINFIEMNMMRFVFHSLQVQTGIYIGSLAF